VATAIFYLLKGGQHSRLHRLKSDELWHFYTRFAADRPSFWTGGKATCGDEAGRRSRRRPASATFAVRAGCWFGATVDDPTGFSLVGCTVAPGFDFADFELANRATLIGISIPNMPR
jgi:predicted cupin superfamily sugar epimerase